MDLIRYPLEMIEILKIKMLPSFNKKEAIELTLEVINRSIFIHKDKHVRSTSY